MGTRSPLLMQELQITEFVTFLCPKYGHPYAAAPTWIVLDYEGLDMYCPVCYNYHNYMRGDNDECIIRTRSKGGQNTL